MEPPGDAFPAEAKISLYLYHLDIDKHLRNQKPLADRSVTGVFRAPPVPLQLRYLLTPLSGDEGNNHLIAGRVIQHFNDFQNFDQVSDPRVPIGDSFGGASSNLRVRYDMLSMEQLSQIWNAFSAPYRLSISLLVETVAIDSGKVPIVMPRAEEVVPIIGKIGVS